MEIYIVFILIYSVFGGLFDVGKKKALIRSTTPAVMVLFTGVSFLISLIWVPFGVSIPFDMLWPITLKGLMFAFAYFVVMKVLQRVDVSVVSLTTIISTVFSILFGMVLFNETITWIQIVGSVFVLGGAIAINFVNKSSKGRASLKDVYILILYALISAISGVIDRKTSMVIEPHQMQFWFQTFFFLFSCMFFSFECIKKKKFLIKKSDFGNWWIYLIGALLIAADMFLYIAYSYPNSQLIVISLVSKFKVIISVFLGIVIFKEQNYWKKIMLALMMFAGIILISL